MIDHDRVFHQKVLLEKFQPKNLFSSKFKGVFQGKIRGSRRIFRNLYNSESWTQNITERKTEKIWLQPKFLKFLAKKKLWIFGKNCFDFSWKKFSWQKNRSVPSQSLQLSSQNFLTSSSRRPEIFPVFLWLSTKLSNLQTSKSKEIRARSPYLKRLKFHTIFLFHMIQYFTQCIYYEIHYSKNAYFIKSGNNYRDFKY